MIGTTHFRHILVWHQALVILWKSVLPSFPAPGCVGTVEALGISPFSEVGHSHKPRGVATVSYIGPSESRAAALGLQANYRSSMTWVRTDWGFEWLSIGREVDFADLLFQVSRSPLGVHVSRGIPTVMFQVCFVHMIFFWLIRELHEKLSNDFRSSAFWATWWWPLLHVLLADIPFACFNPDFCRSVHWTSPQNSAEPAELQPLAIEEGPEKARWKKSC